jgi:phospholipase A1
MKINRIEKTNRFLISAFLITSVSISASINADVLAGSYYSAEQQKQDQINACLASSVVSADSDQTVAQLHEACNKDSKGAVDRRMALEKSVENNPFAIIPYRPNYILPVSYSSGSEAPYSNIMDEHKFDNLEVKFQVSLKYNVFEDTLIDGLDVQVAFTAKSWWQAYNEDSSSPFRETNYEPELIFYYSKPWELIGVPVTVSSISFNHESNGKSGYLSRSWNRVIGELVFDQDNIVWALHAWWRLPEDTKSEQESSRGDDNPDIEEYLGYSDVTGVWTLQNNHNVEFMLRNNLRSDNKGAIELGWTFPLSKHLFGYVQYFNGYGESLIYYNHSTSRVGIGFKLTDWL